LFNAFLKTESRTTVSVDGQILVVGLGSPHGDDQAGWTAIDRLETLSLLGVKLIRLAVPHDLLDWLDEVQELHVIDAAQSVDRGLANALVRFETQNIGEKSLRWQSSYCGNEGDSKPDLIRPTGLRSAGTHQIDILTVLELANCLRTLPKRVVLWTIPASRFGATAGVSKECHLMIEHCAKYIGSELQMHCCRL
jgi:hydrogenase maturation protease